MSDKRVTALGQLLYLVEGAVRWAIYDLRRENIISIDKRSGEFLYKMENFEGIEYAEKKHIISSLSPNLWNKIQAFNIADRLFKPNSVQCSLWDSKFDLLWLEVTDACNQQCVHCYVESKSLREKFMSLEVGKKALSQGKMAGFRFATFIGGEPFLHPYLWEMVKYAYDLDYERIEIFTNLTLVTEGDFKQFQEFNVRIATTLLGPDAKVHDSCTKKLGSFQRWYHNVKRIKTLGIPCRISAIRMKQNEKTINDIQFFLYKEGLLGSNGFLVFDDIRLVGRGNSGLLPDTPLKRKSRLRINPNFFHRARKYNTCWYGKIAVTTNGIVLPCIFARKLIIGNLNDEDLPMVLQRLKKAYWKFNLDRVEKCRDCEFRYACKDCRILSLSTNNGLCGAPWWCDYQPYRN